MAKLNYKYGTLKEDGTIVYAPYRLHYGRTYVINASEKKYRECGYYPVRYNDMPGEQPAEDEYYTCVYEYKSDADETLKHIEVNYKIVKIEE